jgi:hypothetical protein
MAFDSTTKAALAEASDLAQQAFVFDRRDLHPAGPRNIRGEPMKVVVVTNTLRAIGGGKTSVLDLQGAAPKRAGETAAAAM